jgi:DNA modification methylase
MMEPTRRRRSLTHVGGAIVTEGEPDAAQALARALDVPPTSGAEDDPDRAHVHGFHSYPARLHPETAARLVEAFVRPGGRLLDPFCGSGTVLVEARRLGRHAFGLDLNPLAVRLARCKLRPRSPDDLARLTALAGEAAAEADARRKARAGASRRFPPEDVALFEPHVLLELDSLRGWIAGRPDEPVRADLELVLSAILVKLSRRAGDTSRTLAPRRIAAGFAARMFVRKAEDLARRLAEYAALVPADAPPAVVEMGDATDLRPVPGQPLDAVITSPPYAATYDYQTHHDVRLRWLGLDPGPLARGELGSRSRYRQIPVPAARHVWAGELARLLESAGRVLPPGAVMVVVMADSAVGGIALRADAIIADVARATGFFPAARASQPRPHFHSPTRDAFRDQPRFEHALLLRRLAGRGRRLPVYYRRQRRLGTATRPDSDNGR